MSADTFCRATTADTRFLAEPVFPSFLPSLCPLPSSLYLFFPLFLLVYPLKYMFSFLVPFGSWGLWRRYMSGFFFHTSTSFQLLNKPWSQVSSLLPPGSRLQFLLRMSFSNPTARRFSSSVANSRTRASRKSICTQQEKVPTNLYEYALRGARTRETDVLYIPGSRIT